MSEALDSYFPSISAKRAADFLFLRLEMDGWKEWKERTRLGDALYPEFISLRFLVVDLVVAFL